MSVDTWCSFTDVRRESDLRHPSPALTHLQLGHAPRDLCTSCGASQSGAESRRLGAGSWPGLGLLEAILFLPRPSGPLEARSRACCFVTDPLSCSALGGGKETAACL